jgi:hypothetical protein
MQLEIRINSYKYELVVLPTKQEVNLPRED